MIAHLSVTTPRGALAADLDPKGITTLRGPSGAGKSALVAAGIAAITGARFYGSTVEARSGGGTALRIDQADKDRSFDAAPKAGAPYRGKVAADFRRWSPLGADPELVDVIAGHLDGRRWQDLAVGTGSELRDLLLRVLPTVDVRQRILAAVGDSADPALLVVRVKAGRSDVILDAADPGYPEALVKHLEAAQTAANAAETAALARRDQAAATVARLRAELPAEPDTEAIAAAARVVSTAKAWADYDAAVARHAEAVDRQQAQRDAREDWRRRKAAIVAPVIDSAALTAAEARVTEAAREVRRLELEAEQLAAARPVAAPDHPPHVGATFPACPTCGQALPIDAGADLPAAAHRAPRADRRPVVTPPEARLAQAEATAARDAIRAEHAAARTAHEAALRALGAEPRVDEEPRTPTAPPQLRPTAEALATAQALSGGAVATRGAYERAVATLRHEEAELGTLEVAATTATARAVLVRATLAAARRVPGEVATEQLGALGDIAPARVRLPTTGTTRAEVVYVQPDGTEQAFGTASKGEQLVGDVALRAGIRRAAAARYGPAWKWCPLVVDPGDYCGGEVPLPVLPAPAWVHRSAGGDGITVVTTAGEQRIGRLAEVVRG